MPVLPMVEFCSSVRLVEEGECQNGLHSLGKRHASVGADRHTVELACRKRQEAVKRGEGKEGGDEVRGGG